MINVLIKFLTNSIFFPPITYIVDLKGGLLCLSFTIYVFSDTILMYQHRSLNQPSEMRYYNCFDM